MCLPIRNHFNQIDLRPQLLRFLPMWFMTTPRIHIRRICFRMLCDQGCSMRKWEASFQQGPKRPCGLNQRFVRVADADGRASCLWDMLPLFSLLMPHPRLRMHPAQTAPARFQQGLLRPCGLHQCRFVRVADADGRAICLWDMLPLFSLLLPHPRLRMHPAQTAPARFQQGLQRPGGLHQCRLVLVADADGRAADADCRTAATNQMRQGRLLVGSRAPVAARQTRTR